MTGCAPGVRLGLVSLGCDKNTVDSERLLATLVGHGARRVRDLGEAEVVVVNTCGFIDAAKEESIETLLEAAALKEAGGVRAVVAVGCMVERHRAAMREALPEVDLFLGLRDLDRLVPELQSRGLLGDPLVDHPGARLPVAEDRHVAYLKVSEGCDHGCAFCAIPLWRGRHRSFSTERLVAEAGRLEARGAVELALVAQDLAHYGRDRRDGTDLPSLLRALLDGTGIPWIRMLYIYSAGIREPLLELMAAEPRIVPYIDMPIQHASDPVLERMRRPERRARLRERIARMREAIPELTLRTTVLVGFPGETEEDFRALLDFLEEVGFDRVGAFAFSPQEGTRAAGLREGLVPEEVARVRLAEVVEVQRAVSAERMAAEIGRLRPAIVDRPLSAEEREAAWPPGPRTAPEGPSSSSFSSSSPRWSAADPGEAPFAALGRLAAQAPDVDGDTVLLSERPLRPGALVEALVTGAGDYDLVAEGRRSLRRAPGAPATPGTDGTGEPARRPVRPLRTLPLAPLGLETAWGR